MKVDKIGNEIKVGDKVVFGMGQSMTLLIGEVTKINTKTVTILRKWKQWGWDGKEVFECPVIASAKEMYGDMSREELINLCYNQAKQIEAMERAGF